MTTLSEILIKLSKKELQVKLLVGYQDAINGYGWHTVYYIQITKTIEYCNKCRIIKNVDYFDNYTNHHQHSHRIEREIIFSERFRHDEDLINGLSQFLLNFNMREAADKIN